MIDYALHMTKISLEVIQNLESLRSQKSQVVLAPGELMNVAKKKSDWHSADIKAALAKKGYSLARLARENGYADTSPSNAFRQSWPAMEKIMAAVIGIPPQEIWPSRYNSDGTPYRTVRLARVRRARNG